jgi:hypothetical protein
MVLIRLIAADDGPLRERLARLFPSIQLEGGDGDGDLRLFCLRRPTPAWCPADHRGAVLLLSPREPADPVAAFIAGVDAWLPETCADGELAAQIRALLGPAAT